MFGSQDYSQNWDLPFRAQITAKTQVSGGDLDGTWLYDWVELSFDPTTGKFVKAKPPRIGVAENGSQAREINNAEVEVGTNVFMRVRGLVGGKLLYDFQVGAAADNAWDPILVTGGPEGTGGDFQPVTVLDKTTRAAVRDGLLWLFPNQDPVEVGTYLGGFFTGVMDDTDQTPVYTKNWPGDSGGQSKCKGCGWLIDKEALKYKALRVTFPRHFGRCECFDLSQGQADDPDGEILAIYDGGTDSWVGLRNFQTCCGCAKISFQIDPDAEPKITGTMVVSRSCSDGSGSATEYTYQLKFICCGDETALFAGGGPDNCGPLVLPPHCSNQFEVLVECVDRPTTACGCPGCFVPKPLAWDFPASGFTDPLLNGPWILSQPHWPDGTGADNDDCTYRSVCPDGPVLRYDEGSKTWILTVGPFTYTLARGNYPDPTFNCAGPNTMNITSPSGEAPSTVTITGIGSTGEGCCRTGVPCLQLTITAIGGDMPSAWLGYTFILNNVGVEPPWPWITDGGVGPEGGNCSVVARIGCGADPDTFQVEFEGDLENFGGGLFTATSTNPIMFTGSVSVTPPTQPLCGGFDDWIVSFVVTECPP